VSRRPGWLGVALALSVGALAGVALTLALGGGRSAHVTTITVPPPAPEDTSLAAKGPVPAVVGRPVREARRRLARSGFLVEVRGAGRLALLLSRGWTVTAQVPRAGTVAPTGSTVRLVVARR
jgi:hypothetical protein